MLTTRFTNIEAAATQDWENFVMLKKKNLVENLKINDK